MRLMQPDAGRAAPDAAGPSLGEIERIVAGQHYDPHSVLGAHPGPDGVIIRALRPLATSVTAVLDDGRRLPMEHVHQGVFAVTVPDEKVPGYRIAAAYGSGSGEDVRDDPYRYLPTLGEFDLYLIGEGRHEELWRVLGAHAPRGGPDVRRVVRRLGAERARGPGHRRLQRLGRPRVPDALARRVRGVGAVRAGRHARAPSTSTRSAARTGCGGRRPTRWPMRPRCRPPPRR